MAVAGRGTTREGGSTTHEVACRTHAWDQRQPWMGAGGSACRRVKEAEQTALEEKAPGEKRGPGQTVRSHGGDSRRMGRGQSWELA